MVVVGGRGGCFRVDGRAHGKGGCGGQGGYSFAAGHFTDFY